MRRLSGIDALEKMHLWQTNRYDFDPLKEYFDHTINARHEHLRFHFAHHEIALGSAGKSVPLDRPFVGTVAVHPESGVTAEQQTTRFEVNNPGRHNALPTERSHRVR